MKKDDRFYRDMQRFIAVNTIGPSVLRNQKSKGVIKAAQDFLAGVDIGAFQCTSEAAFRVVLDGRTEELKQRLPKGARNWGSARKALNLFLREICYNRFLCERHCLSDSEEWMELPWTGFARLP